ncbi:MAG: hypothetical protein ABSA74_04280, partial [Candidatus Staskawiczbacteria bacterium]
MSSIDENTAKQNVYNEEQVSLVRDLADKIGIFGDRNLNILFGAIVAGMSRKEDDFKHFLDVASAESGASLKAEAMMVLIRLLLESGNFNEARQLAALLHLMEHHVLHTFARVRIAKFSQDEEDNALAMEFMRELLESYT